MTIFAVSVIGPTTLDVQLFSVTEILSYVPTDKDGNVRLPAPLLVNTNGNCDTPFFA